MPVIDDEETLILEEESRLKMSEKAKDPEVIAKKISHKPIDYENLNSLIDDFEKCFSPQQELSAEQAFWFHILNPSIESSFTPPVIVEVPSELPKVSLVNASLKKLKFHLTQFDSVVKKRTTPNALKEDLLNEIKEVQTVFDQMDTAVQQYSVDKQCLEIAKKEILLENDRLLQKNMSQDVMLTVMNSMSLNNDSVNMEMQECFKDQFDSIKQTRVHHKEQSDSLSNKLNLKSVEIKDLKAQIQDKVFVITSLKNDLRKVKGKEIVENVVHTPSATTIVPVEQAKAKQPLDSELDFACKYATRIKELLVYVQDTCPNAITPSAKKVTVKPMNNVKKVRFAKPLTSSSKIQQAESFNTSDSNTPVLSSTGVKCSTSNYGSKPPGNKENGRISQTPSRNKKNKVEAQPRKVNKVVKIVLWYLDSKCLKHMTGNRSQPMNFVSKFLGTVRFGNDQIARIMGYGDYQLGNVIIPRTLHEWYENVGITHQTYVAQTPQQNGVVERRNQTLVEVARTMQIFSKALLFLWAEAIDTACYTQNRSLIRH
ncbi:retrovirus-related pol polyprotein from transposon TNT 1-94 [Tanacetum coccineum]